MNSIVELIPGIDHWIIFMGMQQLLHFQRLGIQQQQFQREMFYLGDREEEAEEIKIKINKEVSHLEECDQVF